MLILRFLILEIHTEVFMHEIVWRGPGSDGHLPATRDFWRLRSQPPACCGRRAHLPEVMENGAVYSPTTEEDPGPARGPRSGLAAYFFLGRLPRLRRVLKGLKLLLSLLAFICEEVVSQCTLWGTLFFFEFVSDSAFLLSLLILIVYYTPFYESWYHKSKIIIFLYYFGNRMCVFVGIQDFCFHTWQDFSWNCCSCVWIYSKFYVPTWVCHYAVWKTTGVPAEKTWK